MSANSCAAPFLAGRIIDARLPLFRCCAAAPCIAVAVGFAVLPNVRPRADAKKDTTIAQHRFAYGCLTSATTERSLLNTEQHGGRACGDMGMRCVCACGGGPGAAAM
eukprot:gene36947-5096_t